MLRAPSCILTALLLVSTAASAQTSVATSTVAIVPGDYLRVTVWRKPELSGEFLVAADSTLKHPLYQEVKVAGLSIAAAQDRLRTFLGKYEAAPQISIDPLYQVTVGGDVRSPNLYKLSPETNVAQAVALAGGPSESGRLDRVRVVRRGREFTVDLSRSDEQSVTTPVESGDRIFVGHRRSVLRDVVAPLASVAGLLVSVSLLFRK